MEQKFSLPYSSAQHAKNGDQKSQQNYSSNLPVTGFFGQLTRRAVKNFQLAHWQEILEPWVSFGHTGPKVPTGNVYKKTKWYINKLKCESGAGEKPQLP